MDTLLVVKVGVVRALLAASLVAVGLALAPTSAAAVPGRADATLGAGANPACPQPDRVAREAAARFGDIDADYVHAANVGCLVYYGITVGAGDGSRYAPDAAVKRWQMALFMTRAAKRAGVKLPGGDQGFTDLSGLNSAVLAGVNAAAALGIMPGTSATEFSPESPVLRGDMALHLIRMLELVTGSGSPINVEVDDTTGAVTMTRSDGTVITPDDTFGDVEGVVPVAHGHAIGAMFELGVTLGKRPGVYDPDGRVTRAQMAAFIIRLLGHSSLRPDGPIVLEPWMPPAQAALPVDPEGVYAGDPLHLIAHASFERAYSLPGDDGDRLEVWLCNTPVSGRRYSTHADNRHNPANYADKFASQVTDWFDWLSGGLYTPVFSAGGVVDVGPSDDNYRACDEAVSDQDFSDRPPVDGVVIVVGTELFEDSAIGFASCGFFSRRGFPDNSRSILVNGDAFVDPSLLAHEMGHALCWPHSYSGETRNDDGDVWEYDNPMDIMGSPSFGEPDPVPMIGTPAINRYAAGWIPTDQVRIHRLGTSGRYELAPPGEDGVQILVIPSDNDDRTSYLALGARVAESGGSWWADAGIPAEGVEIYDIDQSTFGCQLPDRGYCYGSERRTEPVFDRDDGYDRQSPPHVMTAVEDGWHWGQAGEPASFSVELVAVNGSTFTVDVRPFVDEPEPAAASDWEIGADSGIRGDYRFAGTFANIGSDSSPEWLNLVIRCTGHEDLDIFVYASDSYFSGTPTLEYRFGSQRSPTTLELGPSTDNEAGFLSGNDLVSFVRQLRADTSGVLYVELWDRPFDGSGFEHAAGGELGVAGVETDVEPILDECGY